MEQKNKNDKDIINKEIFGAIEENREWKLKHETDTNEAICSMKQIIYGAINTVI